MDAAENVFDIHVFRRRSAPAWTEARFSTLLFDHLKPDCVFDVGANVGQFATALRCTFEGTILSFEPNPNAFDKLQAAAASDPKWHCFPYALGRGDSHETLYVTEIDVFASLREPGEHSKKHYPSQTKVAKEVRIEVRSLTSLYDELQREYGFKRPFLKMDTQGFDLEVLAGGAGKLHDFTGLMSEVALTPLYEGAPTIERSLAAFRDCGFRIVGLFDVSASDALTELLECNCYCVRNDLAENYAA